MPINDLFHMDFDYDGDDADLVNYDDDDADPVNSFPPGLDRAIAAAINRGGRPCIRILLNALLYEQLDQPSPYTAREFMKDLIILRNMFDLPHTAMQAILNLICKHFPTIYFCRC